MRLDACDQVIAGLHLLKAEYTADASALRSLVFPTWDAAVYAMAAALSWTVYTAVD
jgi:hypothetical protein